MSIPAERGRKSVDDQPKARLRAYNMATDGQTNGLGCGPWMSSFFYPKAFEIKRETPRLKNG